MTSRREFLAAASLGAAASLSAAEPTLGMIFPPANYPVPPEATRLYPSGVRFLAEGLGLPRMTPEGYDAVIPLIVPKAEKLAKAGANAISIMGTSLTFYKGAAFNQDLIDRVRKATGLKTTSMSTAMVEGLKAVNAKRIVVATAYADEVNKRLRGFLGEHGFDVVLLRGLGIESFAEAPPVTDASLLKFTAETYEAADKADALFISCGNLKTLDLIVPLEARTKVPVISSTPHAFWASVRLVGHSGQSKGFGQLLGAVRFGSGSRGSGRRGGGCGTSRASGTRRRS